MRAVQPESVRAIERATVRDMVGSLSPGRSEEVDRLTRARRPRSFRSRARAAVVRDRPARGARRVAVEELAVLRGLELHRALGAVVVLEREIEAPVLEGAG